MPPARARLKIARTTQCVRANMADPLALLRRLAEAPEGSADVVVSRDDVIALRTALSSSEKKCADMWAAASVEGISLQAIAGALNGAMSDKVSSPGALAAAAAYTALLASPGCPAFSLFTSLGFGAALRALKAACAKVGSKEDGGSDARGARAADHPMGEAAEGDDDNDTRPVTAGSDDGLDLARFILVDLAVFLEAFPLRDMPDVLKIVFEFLTEVARTPRAAVAAPPEEALAAIAMRALGRLLRPEHGETLQSAAMLMQRLAPAMRGIVGEGRRGKNAGSAASAARAHAVGLVREVAAGNAVARPAVAALARHLALRCVDIRWASDLI